MESGTPRIPPAWPVGRWRLRAKALGSLALIGCLLSGCPSSAPSAQPLPPANLPGRPPTAAAPPAAAPPATVPPSAASASPGAGATTVSLDVSSQTREGLARFSGDLYAAVAKEKVGNLAVSPLGSFLLLGLLQDGAGAPTHQQIATVTGLKGEAIPEIAKLARGLDTADSLALAQRIYLDASARLVEAYAAKVQPLMADPVQTLPFGTDPASATQTINDWVEERTAGLIENFLPQLEPSTVSVLVSVLHFKGSWQTKFEKSATRPGDFTTASGETVKTPMMSRTEVPSFRTEHGTGVVLPYLEGFDMVFLLPDQGQSPDSMLKALDQLPSRGTGEEVSLRLPRFEFEVPTFKLTDAWKRIGLGEVVQLPNLEPMLVLERKEPLKLEVYHKTYVKVDEEGTEAAAATAVVVTVERAAAPRELQLLTFDRPFAFVLRHSESQAVLMLGRVDRPEILSN